MTDKPPRPALPRRLMAMLYDTLLVLPLIMVSVAASLGLHTLVVGVPGEGQVVQLPPWSVWLVTLLTVLVFFSIFWRKDGQTLGMQAWRIKLVDNQGKPPGTGRAVLRCLAALLSAGCFGLGYLWCLVDSNGRYWHDYLSRTELVLLPQRTKKSKENADA